MPDTVVQLTASGGRACVSPYVQEASSFFKIGSTYNICYPKLLTAAIGYNGYFSVFVCAFLAVIV